MSAHQTRPLLLFCATLVIGCDAAPPPATLIDAQTMDAMLIDAAPVDAAALDTALVDATDLDRGRPDPMDAMALDWGLDLSRVDQGQPPDAGRDLGPPDAQPIDQAVDANRCVVEACNAVDDDCDGRIDEGEACVPAALAGCRVHLSVRDLDGREAGTDSGGDAVFHGFGPPDDVDAGDRLFVAWRCDASLEWAQAHCAVSLAHAGGSEADPVECDASRCVRTQGDGAPVGIEFVSDVDGDDRFAVGFECADDEYPDRAAALQARLKVWLATQHRRVGDDGVCLDEARHERVVQWGFCPGAPVDDEGRHRCASSDGDGRLHRFPVGTLGGIWPDLGPCDTFGVALTR